MCVCYQSCTRHSDWFSENALFCVAQLGSCKFYCNKMLLHLALVASTIKVVRQAIKIRSDSTIFLFEFN